MGNHSTWLTINLLAFLFLKAAFLCDWWLCAGFSSSYVTKIGPQPHSCLDRVVWDVWIYFLSVLGFELRASCLLGSPLLLEPLYHLRHSTSHVLCCFFQNRVSQTVCLGWLWTVILLISASWVARITGVSHWCPVQSVFFTKAGWVALPWNISFSCLTSKLGPIIDFCSLGYGHSHIKSLVSA
jgi:hypothetical protein